MYNATPAAADAWRALFARVFADARVAIEVVEHRWPRPVEELWQREGLCCAFMCGWPFVRARPPMQAIAAPVPAFEAYADLPRYRSEFLVRHSCGWTSLEQTFGHRFGWMAASSQSGFNAPRAHLAQYVGVSGPSCPAQAIEGGRGALFSHVEGPLGTPALALQALREGKVDVIALDSFYLDLLRHHEPGAMEDLRTVATTRWTPIPLLVAAPGVARSTVEAVRAQLVEAHAQPAYAPLLAAACVRRFVAPDLEAYQALERMAREAHEKGYDAIR
jgi:ABC-type phosphate/phosphonate transport system substrate-binding protein